ncbi:MAG: hypothetical protein IT380_12250 [Myxococcales bacterium]|nr:hypothetical protein [Myxococcales bacterium]
MRRFSPRRGAAAVELAVTMVLLVPLIMYTLFLEDLLAYKLEQQEPTIVSGWDYAIIDYQEGKGLGRVPNMNQLKYCDHSSAFDSYDKTYDCNTDGIHHEAGTAHQCWLVPGAKQLACGVSASVGMELLPTNKEFLAWHGQFNKGGMARCTATLAVMNYFLPNKFFNWAAHSGSQRDVIGKSKLGGEAAKKGSANATVHGEAGGVDQTDSDSEDTGPTTGGGAAGSWILKEEVFAVLHDPWALNVIDDTNPNSYQRNHPFWERANVYYDNLTGGFVKQGNKDAKDYREELDELIGSNAAEDINTFPAGTCFPNCGDDPSSLPLAWKKDMTRDFNDGYASGWEDQRMSQANRQDKFPEAWGPP